MAKTKKIPVNAFEGVMKNTPNVEEFEWNGLTVSVTKTIGAKDAVAFAKSVVAESFHSDTGEYIPYLKEYSIRRCVIEMFSNLTMPEDVERQYDLLYRTDAFETVVSHVNRKQLYDILDSINDKIENIAASNAERVNQMAMNVSNTIALVEEKLDTFTNMLSNADVTSLVELVSSANIDKESIANTVIALKNRDKTVAER